MKLDRLWAKTSLLVFLVILLVLVLSYPYLLKGIGSFLVFEQNPRKVDVIVVLNGRDTERSLAAVDLFNQGYANLIIMARGAKQPGSDEFWKRAVNFDGRVFFQRAIEAMGVPQKSFQFIGNGVLSTSDEAFAARGFLKKNGYKSILLVTSKWHSKRAYLTFKSALKKDGIEVVIQPSGYDTFKPDAWWKNRDDAELVFDEYVRLIYYILTSRISLLN